MNRRHATLVALLLAGGCLAPHYGVDATDSVDAGGSPSAGSSGTHANAGQSDGNGAESSGGAPDQGGAPAGTSCDADQKRCGGECVALGDVTYGCGASTCNQSGCPADAEAVLGCESGSCVAVDCTEGFKLCGGRCVSESDPTFGCGASVCDDSECPDPGAGTLICSDGACVVGECPSDAKKCGNKCVPQNEDNGCSAAACDSCASNELCSGSPAVCACIPNGDPCTGFECGSATDSCGKLKECRNECEGTKEPFCVDNTCRQCKAAKDCPAPPADNPCYRAACNSNSCSLTVPAANTPCSGGGKCSVTLPGVCDRPAIKVGTFDIDATEVTRGQYAAFLKAKNGNTDGQHAACIWNDSYTPQASWSESTALVDYPVVSVDWCDAHAYCKWSGRRLCGKRGGGSLDLTVDHTGALSQWVHACLPAGGGKYPYGSSFDVDACNGKSTAGGPVRVATFPGCVGGAPGLYDLSGNVSEWQDACNGYTDEEDSCATQGGRYGSDDSGATLVCSFGHAFRRDSATAWIGFRCCSSP